MASTAAASPAVVAGAVPARNVNSVKILSRSSVLFGQRMHILCADARLCMRAPGIPEVPSGFSPGELKGDIFSPILSGSTGKQLPPQASPEGTDAPTEPVAALRLVSDLLKRKANREELRRKRLVRKRHLRKTGVESTNIVLVADKNSSQTLEKPETVATVADAGPSTGAYIGSPLLWIGVGVGLSAFFSWAAGRFKKYAMQQVFKTMTRGMPGMPGMQGMPNMPGMPTGQPFPFSMPPTGGQQGSSLRPASSQLVDVEAISKPEKIEKKDESPVITLSTSPTPATAASPKPSVFTDVSASTIEEEKSAAATAAATANAKQETQEQKKPFFQDREVVDSGVGWNSDVGSSSKASDGKPGSVFTVDALERMMEDPMVQQMVYPYLPEEMRNPATFKWMMQNPQYREQLQDMLNNMGGDGAWDNRMSDMLKNFDLNSSEVKQQFEQIGLTPQEVVSKIMGNPEVALAFQNPRVQAAIMDCSQNPLNITKYQNDKEVMDVFNKISELFPGMTGAPY